MCKQFQGELGGWVHGIRLGRFPVLIRAALVAFLARLNAAVFGAERPEAPDQRPAAH